MAIYNIDIQEQVTVHMCDLYRRDSREKKLRSYVGFIDLEKGYDMVCREALFQVLRMYDVGGKLLNGIRSTYARTLACIQVKLGDSEYFRNDRGEQIRESKSFRKRRLEAYIYIVSGKFEELGILIKKIHFNFCSF